MSIKKSEQISEAECACAIDESHGHHGCSCGHEHGHESEGSLRGNIIRIGLSAALVVIAMFVPQPFSLFLYVAAYLTAGGTVLTNAVKNTLHGELFDENFLMAIATVGAFAIGEFTEAVAVMIFYEIGELFQDMAVARSRKNIEGLMNIRPDYAVLLNGTTETRIAPEDAKVGDIIIIKPGERVPLDCTVLSGKSTVDASALTGESVPQDVALNNALLNGSVNLTGVLTCQVTGVYSDSTVQKILSLVSDAGDKKANAEKLITRFSRIYTPCVIGAAVLIAAIPPIFFGGVFSEWFYRGLIFLVISCPCALVISIPVGFFGGIGGGAKNGILIKGGNVIDLLYAPKTVILDKTGTLTKGSFELTEVQAASEVTRDELFRAAMLCERSSNHPIAVSVRKACHGKDSGEEILQYNEVSGFGVTAKTIDATYAAGNAKLMQKLNIALPAFAPCAATVLYVAKGGRYLGRLLIADEMKESTPSAIKELRSLGVEKCYMLTGDNDAIAKDIAQKAGLDGYQAGLLPQDKITAFEKIAKETNGICMFAGDGINDAPLLARADVGIAMGGVGSDAAIEAADAVLMTDDISRIASAIRIARGTRRIIVQNIALALGVKLIVLAVAAFGAVPMWLAIFADVGVALLAVANAARAVMIKA
ncbi:MAG: heavy metal translocating P-type ATPase [Oscillospiraceae bacterium]